MNSKDRAIRVRAGDGCWIECNWIECKSWNDAYKALRLTYELVSDWFFDVLEWSVVYREICISERMSGAMFVALYEDASAFHRYLQDRTNFFEKKITKEVFCLQYDNYGKTIYDSFSSAIKYARYNHAMGDAEFEVWRAIERIDGEMRSYDLLEKMWPLSENKI